MDARRPSGELLGKLDDPLPSADTLQVLRLVEALELTPPKPAKSSTP
jgi:hypothetical protein